MERPLVKFTTFSLQLHGFALSLLLFVHLFTDREFGKIVLLNSGRDAWLPSTLQPVYAGRGKLASRSHRLLAPHSTQILKSLYSTFSVMRPTIVMGKHRKTEFSGNKLVV